MLEKTHLTAYLAVPPFGPPREKAYLSRVSDMVGEICDSSGRLEFPMHEYETVIPGIDLLDLSRISEEIIDQFQTGPLKEGGDLCQILKVAVEVPLPRDPDMTAITVDEIPGGFHAFNARRYFVKRLYDLALTANIANVGSFSFGPAIIVQDGNLTQNTDAMFSDTLYEAWRFSEMIGWPVFREPPFIQVWNWAINFHGFLDGYGEDSLTRALSAYSMLFRGDVVLQTPSLFWALVGIEAICAQGAHALSHQLREKAYIFLGSQVSYKKKLRGMYNLRSRLVHGDLNFPAWHTLRETQQFDYLGELEEAMDLAVSILVATLQEVARRDWRGLSFSYEVEDLPL